MPIHKVSTFLSEISTFFKKDSAEGAMFTIMSVIKGIKMNEQTLFGRRSRCNSVYSLLHVFQLLLVCPCFMIRNPFGVMSADVVFVGIPVRLFFIRRSKRGQWGGLLCTDMKLGFLEAYRIYSRRWSLEVIFKEGKGLLGLGKCQSNNFSAQIASTSLVALQYNVLSVAKRFTAYETIGGLFRAANRDSLEITISERIWGVILELVAATTRVFNITDEEVLEAVANESDELAHICELYRYKMAS